MEGLLLDDKTRWLSLGNASRLLDVSQATLRQWADGGYLQAYRTVGGHRRFLRDHVEAFIEGRSVEMASEWEEALESSALRRIRRRLHQESVARQPWYKSVEAGGRVRMRLFGRRLLSLLAREASLRGRRREVFDEAHLLGREHGSEMAERGLPLKDVVEVFVFFRNLVLSSASPRSWHRILELSDRSLTGIIDSHQECTLRLAAGELKSGHGEV